MIRVVRLIGILHGRSFGTSYNFRLFNFYDDSDDLQKKNERDSKFKQTNYWKDYAVKGKKWNFKQPEIHRLDPEEYFDLCRKLESKTLNIFPDRLISLPEVSLSLNDHRNFVDNCFLNWLGSFKMISVDRFHKPGLAKLVESLQSLNYLTNGDVLKLIGWGTVEKIAELSLSSTFRKFSSQSLASVLRGLRKFGPPISEELKRAILNALTSFFTSLECKKSLYTSQDEFGQIFYSLAKLNLPAPRNQYLKTSVDICFKNLTFVSSRRNISIYHEMWTVSAMAEAFIIWNIDPDTCNVNFWLLFYQTVAFHFGSMLDVKKRFLAILLNQCLISAIKFGKEKEFQQIKKIWSFEMDIYSEYLTADDVERIFSVAKEKYIDKTDRFGDLMPKEILEKLMNRRKK